MVVNVAVSAANFTPVCPPLTRPSRNS